MMRLIFQAMKDNVNYAEHHGRKDEDKDSNEERQVTLEVNLKSKIERRMSMQYQQGCWRVNMSDAGCSFLILILALRWM